MNAKTLVMTAVGVLILGGAMLVLLGDDDGQVVPGASDPSGGGSVTGPSDPGAVTGAGDPGSSAPGPGIRPATVPGSRDPLEARPGPGDPLRPGVSGDGAPRPAGATRPEGSQGASPPPREGAVRAIFRCLESGGGPLPGVRIEARRGSGAPLPPLLSDARGEATTEDLPAGEALEGVARHPLSGDPVTFGPVELRADSALTLTFERSRTGRLAGRIVDDTGAPVQQAELVLVDPRQPGEAVLDGVAMSLGPDGSFLATVAAGTYAVSARGAGLSQSDRAYATVVADEQAGPVELVVPRQGAISGRVQLPADLSAVLPVSLDLVCEVTRGTAENPYTRTERVPLEVDATFTFALPRCDPGRYRLRLEVPQAGGNRVGRWVECTLAPGGRLDGLTLALQEVGVSIRGFVRDERSQPVDGAVVAVRGREARSDRSGYYELRGLDLGSILLEARKDGHAPAFRQLTFEGEPLQVDLDLLRAGAVRGRVVGRGGPGAGVEVLVMQRSDLGVRPHRVTTDAEGTYSLEGLTPGSYYVKAGRGADPFDDAGAPSVTVRPGETVEVPPLSVD